MPIQMEIVNYNTFKWGPWLLNSEYPTILEHEDTEYYIRLSEMVTSAATLDWIMQVVSKVWCDDQTANGLLSAISDLIKPQSNLCSGGADHRISDGITGKDIQHAIFNLINKTGFIESKKHPYIQTIHLPGEEADITYPDYEKACLKILKDPNWGKQTDYDLTLIKELEESLNKDE